MYIDLNIPHNLPTQEHKMGMAAELLKLGFTCIALNYECDEKQKPKLASHIELFPLPKELTVQSGARIQSNLLRVKNAGKEIKLRQFTRITMTLEDVTIAHSLNSSHKILSTYDIIAIVPESGRVFQHLCEFADIDIISFPIDRKLPFALRKAQLDQAISRGIVFEFSYSSTLTDSNSRRYFFSNLNSIIKMNGGKNIIITSNASRPIWLRGPYDIVNLAMLAGLPYGKAMDTISSTCQHVLHRAEQKKSQTGIMLQN